jgi:hypothetical protein
MFNNCEECSSKKHIRIGRYNLCENCHNRLQKEYDEYKKHVHKLLSFEDYVKMTLIAKINTI